MKSPFWVNEVYSIGHWLKKYALYPTKLPLCNYIDHGMPDDTIPKHEIENEAPLIFKFPPRLVEEYKKVSKKPVYCLMNPTIFYRLKNKIKQNQEAKGTLFFVAHSTPIIDDNINWEHFIINLNNIPEQFKPIDICLHNHDIVKGLDNIFKLNKFKVVCIGNPNNKDFVKDFYSILKNYKFTMSNLIGSYTFYSVEMNIPFSLFGEEPKYYNKGDENIEFGDYDSYKSQPTYQKAFALFNNFYNKITNEQNEFVNFELGKTQTIGRIKACLLLYKALIVYTIKNKKLINIFN